MDESRTEKYTSGSRTIELASSSGFCFGVQRAIQVAEETLARGRRVWSLGPVIHNPQEIERLEAMGLRVIREIDEADEGLLVVRSHGISPETLRAAEARGLELADATCPLVKRVQSLAQQLHQEGYSVVVAGDARHPEVEAVLGYAPGALVVDGPADLEVIAQLKKIGVVSQTTKSPEEFHEVVAEIARRFAGQELRIFATICSATVDRQSSAMELARRVDVMFVLGGRNSSNTRQLARRCEATGVRTHHLETAAELTGEMLVGGLRIGVTAGASTPRWVVEEFIDRVKSLDAPG